MPDTDRARPYTHEPVQFVQPVTASIAIVAEIVDVIGSPEPAQTLYTLAAIPQVDDTINLKQPFIAAETQYRILTVHKIPSVYSSRFYEITVEAL